MKRSATILALAATVSLGATSVVHAGETEEPTYQEFKTQTLQDEDRQYIVNGDIPVSGERQLRDFYQGLVEPSHEANLETVKLRCDAPTEVVKAVARHVGFELAQYEEV